MNMINLTYLLFKGGGTCTGLIKLGEELAGFTGGGGVGTLFILCGDGELDILVADFGPFGPLGEIIAGKGSCGIIILRCCCGC